MRWHSTIKNTGTFVRPRARLKDALVGKVQSDSTSGIHREERGVTGVFYWIATQE